MLYILLLLFKVMYFADSFIARFNRSTFLSFQYPYRPWQEEGMKEENKNIVVSFITFSLVTVCWIGHLAHAFKSRFYGN